MPDAAVSEQVAVAARMRFQARWLRRRSCCCAAPRITSRLATVPRPRLHTRVSRVVVNADPLPSGALVLSHDPIGDESLNRLMNPAEGCRMRLRPCRPSRRAAYACPARATVAVVLSSRVLKVFGATPRRVANVCHSLGVQAGVVQDDCGIWLRRAHAEEASRHES